MTDQSFNVADAFGPDQAATYDQRFEGMQAIKDAIHLVLRAHFTPLPETARILVAGAGTGAEVRYLAGLFPHWQFTLADPSAAMLDIARNHARAEGFEDRCTFHPDYVSTLPDTDFDAATSLLVSHFLTDAKDRQVYFQSITDRLKPGALFFNADLCADMDGASFDAVMGLWLGFMKLVGMDEQGRENYLTAFGTAFACHGPAEVEAMMQSAGFSPPAQCFQAGLIRGWITSLA